MIYSADETMALVARDGRIILALEDRAPVDLGPATRTRASAIRQALLAWHRGDTAPMPSGISMRLEHSATSGEHWAVLCEARTCPGGIVLWTCETERRDFDEMLTRFAAHLTD